MYCYIIYPRCCLRFWENIGYSQSPPMTLALSDIWQLLSDASLATPAEPTLGGSQLCKSQIKHNLYSSQHFSTVIWAMYCPWDIHKWFYGSGRFRKRTGNNKGQGRRFVLDMLDHRPVSWLNGWRALKRDGVHRHSGYFGTIHEEMENLIKLPFCWIILINFFWPATNNMKTHLFTICMYLFFPSANILTSAVHKPKAK